MSNTTQDTASASSSAIVKSDVASTVELTAYESGPAVIRETRDITLPQGKSKVYIGGLPKTFVPNSQTIVAVQGSGKFRVGQRSLRPANLSSQAILAKSVGTKITLIEETKAGTERRTTGVLEHIVDNRIAVLRVRGQIVLIPLTTKFALSNGIPAGLSDLTILALEPNVETAGDFRIKLLYETEAVNWTPWYEVFYNRAAGKLERFACYVDLTNESGATFNDAGIKLISGNNFSDAANRARPKNARYAMAAMAPMGGARAASLEAVADFSQDSAESESVGDQKMYKLTEPVTLENGVPNSPALVFFGDVPVVHEYHAYEAGQDYYTLDSDNPSDLPKLPVSVKLRLCNQKGNGLGAPLPPGEVRIFEPDSTGELQKTDSARVSDHVADGEEFALDLRNPARDIKVQRQLVTYKEDPEAPKDEPETQHPIKPQGGPNVGQPNFGARAEMIAEGAEGSEEASEAGGKKKRARKPKARYAEATREITVLNFKDTAVEVVVHDSVPANAKLLDKSHDFVKFADKAGSGCFRVTVPGKNEASVAGEFKIRYQIKYRIN